MERRPVMLITCACQPGDEENGWNENRCNECIEIEMQEFSRAIERWTNEGGRDAILGI